MSKRSGMVKEFFLTYVVGLIVLVVCVLLWILVVFGTLATVVTIIDPILIEIFGEDIAHTIILSLVIFVLVYSSRAKRR